MPETSPPSGGLAISAEYCRFGMSRPDSAGGRRGPLLGCLLLLCCAALLGACASLPRQASPELAEELVALLDRGAVDKLAALSAPPFLLDGEVLSLESDLLLLWTNFFQAGLDLAPTRLLAIEEPSAGSWPSGPVSLQVSVFMKRDLAPGAKVLVLAGPGGPWRLIVEPLPGSYRIRGIGAQTP